MKQLLYIIFITAGSWTAFSQNQEKKGVCSASIQLFHNNGGSISNDYFSMDGFTLNYVSFSGAFSVDSGNYEITLPVGDSLLYSAYWKGDGQCFYLDSASTTVISMLEGTPFPIVYGGSWDFQTLYDLSQKGTIKNSCRFKIQKETSKSYFIRVKFQDPPQPESPLIVPEHMETILLWLSNENTLTVKADQDTDWDMMLYALSGQLIQKISSEGSCDLDISALSKGCYITRISSKTGLEKQLEFIK